VLRRKVEGFAVDPGIWINESFGSRVYWMPSTRTSKHYLSVCNLCSNVSGCSLISETKNAAEMDAIPTGSNFRCDMVNSFCEPGYYCPFDGYAYTCPAGRYGNVDNNSSPECSGTCKGGCFCPKGSTSDCPQSCPAGYYCPVGAAEPKLCPPNFYCPAGSEKPVQCPAGYFCRAGSSNLGATQNVTGNNGTVSCQTYCSRNWNSELPNSWQGARAIATNLPNIDINTVPGFRYGFVCTCQQTGTGWIT
jgi:hypothetical protein